MKKYCIATSQAPSLDNFEPFMESIHAAAKEAKCEIRGYSIGGGRGCFNHGILLYGEPEDQESLMRMLTMALMPARYTEVSFDDQGVNEEQFGFREE